MFLHGSPFSHISPSLFNCRSERTTSVVHIFDFQCSTITKSDWYLLFEFKPPMSADSNTVNICALRDRWLWARLEHIKFGTLDCGHRGKIGHPLVTHTALEIDDRGSMTEKEARFHELSKAFRDCVRRGLRQLRQLERTWGAIRSPCQIRGTAFSISAERKRDHQRFFFFFF